MTKIQTISVNLKMVLKSIIQKNKELKMKKQNFIIKELLHTKIINLLMKTVIYIIKRNS